MNVYSEESKSQYDSLVATENGTENENTDDLSQNHLLFAIPKAKSLALA